VGLFAIASSILKGSSQVFAVDTLPSRLALAKKLGAQVINFNELNPVEAIKEATGGYLADVVIDAVGVDAVHPTQGPGAKEASKLKENFDQELKKIAPKTNIDGNNWTPGNAPSQALRYAVDMVKKCGRISIIGVYPQTLEVFQIGKAMNKNLTLVMGNCPHRRYIPKLLQLVQGGIFDPTTILSQQEPLISVVEAYKHFDRRETGWIKVALLP
jgi:threonine dehydrogenase-like Zn-dependent dehydrogenase